MLGINVASVVVPFQAGSLLMEVLLVMKLDFHFFELPRPPAALMRALFVIVDELLLGLTATTDAESDAEIRSKLSIALVMTGIIWCTHPVAYLSTMLGINTVSAGASLRLVCC